jgi:GT2 family glycosyltransferase
MIHVIIPVYNRINLTLRCIGSLQKQKNFDQLNIVIVDDGSKDNTTEIINKIYPNIQILQGTGNLFAAGCFELAISTLLKKCDLNDWILLVSNDSELADDAIIQLVNFANIKKRKILAGAMAVSAEDRQTIVRSGAIIWSWFFNIIKHVYDGKKINKLCNLKAKRVDFIPGRCLLHPVEIFNVAGNYNPKKFKHYGSDEEFSIRAKKNGFDSYIVPKSLTYVTPNRDIVKVKLSLQYFLFTFFDERSCVNIVDKLKITFAIVPFYAKLTFFLVGILKTFYFFIKSILK